MMDVLKKNEIYDCEITGWSSDGAGVTRVGERAVFVPGTIPGERWEVRIVKVRTASAFGKGERCLRPAPERIEPDCPAYPRCGGCTLRHMTYAKELEFKLDRVNEAYRRIGGLDLRASEILGATETEGYRNKAVYAVDSDLRPGFFRPRSHDVIPVERCRLQSEAADRAAWAVCDFCRDRGIPAYDEATGKGTLRHIFTRTARDGRMLVTVVAASGFGAQTDALSEAVYRACLETVGVILNVNKTAGNTVLAGEFYTLRGAGTLTDTLCGEAFDLSPMSFYQVNPAQAERLYAKAIEFAAPAGNETVLDLYCGAGTISLCLARKAARVIGAEIVPAAVENARANAARNGLHNVEFLCADAGEAARELARRGVRPDAVVLDPPRKGLAPEVIDTVCAMAPARVVYVSCDVATQARDLKRFADQGYIARTAVAVDMFPRTAHCETAVKLTKADI
jgi:23S rRNA (uracil1939-C5)-methyltransferase